MSDIEVKLIVSQTAWDAFVLRLLPNTFLQSWQWGQFQEQQGEIALYLGLYRGPEQIGAALVILVKARRGYHYIIPHGPLWLSPADVRGSIQVIATFLRAHATTTGAVGLRIAPLLLATPAHYGIFRELGFRAAPLHIHTELTWVLDINESLALLLKAMRKTTRQAIAKAAAAGVTTEIITDVIGINRFWPLYEQTRQRHKFVPFSQEFLRQQFTVFASTGNAYLVMARYRGRDIAGAILIQYGNTVFYHHGASVNLAASVSGAQFTQWQAIQEAQRRGATRYNFWGIAPAEQPDHPFTGITVFKKGFGGFALDYLHAQDLPLTRAYWKLWAVDHWRKYRRGF
ncbi:MAG: peptidoglycan bridge formation glycyltransferase FemA/FemB family protein [Candidatus Andersenbacteria bacterium]